MGHPVPFPAAPAIPIVGQPCTVVAWFPTLNLVCNCEAKQPLLVVGFGNLTVCPACKRGFMLQAVKHDSRTPTPPHFDINVVLATSQNGSGAEPPRP